MTTEHKGIEPVAFVMAGVLLNMHQDARLNRTQWQALLRCTQVDESEVPLYPQSAIDTLQAEKAALESQLQEARFQYISDFGPYRVTSLYQPAEPCSLYATGYRYHLNTSSHWMPVREANLSAAPAESVEA